MSEHDPNPPGADAPISDATRLLVVCPSWVGDAIMATPALRRLRTALPGLFIGALVRPGVDQVLGGVPTDRPPLLDEIHVERRAGVMGPKRSAAIVRARRYDTAVLLTNSFSSALAARMAGIPTRIGYDRDGRGMLLTTRLKPPKRPDGTWALVPAVDYYHALIDATLERFGKAPDPSDRPPMELAIDDTDRDAANAALERSVADLSKPLAILNPGGNNPAKRWPTDRFANLADHLAREHGMTVLLSGSPAEEPLIAEIDELSRCACVRLPALGLTLASLKPIVQRCVIMITNDTGPRHIAAALGVPVVTLFGPTDHRWTTIPTKPLPDGGPRETIVLADPTLPETESANDHPDRCAITNIGVARVVAATDELLARARP